MYALTSKTVRLPRSISDSSSSFEKFKILDSEIHEELDLELNFHARVLTCLKCLNLGKMCSAFLVLGMSNLN